MAKVIFIKAVVLWAIGCVIVAFIDFKVSMSSQVRLLLLALWLTFVTCEMTIELLKNKNHE